MNKIDLGWNDFLQQHLIRTDNENSLVGRVMLEHKRLYRVMTEKGELLSEISGRYRFEVESREEFPTVGDWVVLTERVGEGKAIINSVLPRYSKFSRKNAGTTTEEQIVAANVDTVFLVQSLNHDLNVRRLERYLISAWESGSNPVVVLTKADLCNDIENEIAEIETVAFGVPIHVVSVKERIGLEVLQQYFQRGKTVALLGSSGAGKSTLTNYLLDEEKMVIKGIREDDDKGRHTTTYRELHVLTDGGLVLDTPGMRELQLWEVESGLQSSFQDIEELAEACKFRDCTHNGEPNCAVREAIQEGNLDLSRFQSYVKLQRELAFLERKNDKRAQSAEKDKWKKVHKTVNRSRK